MDVMVLDGGTVAMTVMTTIVVVVPVLLSSATGTSPSVCARASAAVVVALERNMRRGTSVRVARRALRRYEDRILRWLF